MRQGKASIAVMRDKGQLTIPSAIRAAFGIEPGDAFDVLVTAKGILLRRRRLVDATQAWFWTRAWQTAEKEASDDIRAGRIRTHQTQKGFLRRFAK